MDYKSSFNLSITSSMFVKVKKTQRIQERKMNLLITDPETRVVDKMTPWNLTIFQTSFPLFCGSVCES
jgi:hypothetical protein